MSRLSSRERVLSALRYEQQDDIPLLFNTFGFHPPAPAAWSNQVEEAGFWLSHGVDALLGVGPEIVFHPDVTVRGWEETLPGARWPLMVKEYDTPAGVLRQEVWRTGDWISGEWPNHKDQPETGIQLCDDYNVPRSRKFAIETEADLAKLQYLLLPLDGAAARRLRDRAGEVCRQAARLGVAVEAEGSRGVDMVTWLCGVNNMVMMAVDQPELFAALLDIIHAWDLRATELLLETQVDIVVRRGWYEGTTFWSPKLFKQFFLPRFRDLSERIHASGRLMGYKNSAGFMPLLDLLLQAGYDTHYFIDPVMGGSGVDLGKIKTAFDGRISIIGGMNSPVTLERGTPDEIRQAVRNAIDLLGPHGLVVCPVDCISASTPWSSVELVIEAWKESQAALGAEKVDPRGMET